MKGAAASIALLQTARGREEESTGLLQRKFCTNPNYKVVPNWPGQERQLFLEPSAKTSMTGAQVREQSNGKSLPTDIIFLLYKDSPTDTMPWKPQP